jgi:hypothetical protein
MRRRLRERLWVNDSPDKDVHLHVDKKSKRDGTFDAGDKSL